MAGVGLNLNQIAAIIGVSPATLDRRIKDTPAIAEAISKGRSDASEKVMNTAFQMATSGTNPAMTIFWLKVRERWKEPDRDINLNVSQIPTAQLVEKAKEAIQYLEAEGEKSE